MMSIHCIPGLAHKLFTLACGAGLTLAATTVSAETQTDRSYTYNLYGTPGLIDLPTARSAPDAEFGATVSQFGITTRNTLTFQITPRLSGSFRYSRIETNGAPTDLFDRSFDVRYRFIDEGAINPSIAIGLRDIIGTGVYSSEYIVATKQVSPNVEVTAGLGWGRLGGLNGFQNPLSIFSDSLKDRPFGTTGNGGQFEIDRWFRGDAALFAGVEWWMRDDLRFALEYSSDEYPRESGPELGEFDRASPINAAVTYNFTDDVAFNAYYLYGSEFGAGLTFTLNPKSPAVIGDTGIRPTPVVPRRAGAAQSAGWVGQENAVPLMQGNVARLLEFEGMSLQAMEVTPRAVTVLIENETYVAPAQAIGRTARILTRALPASIETFTIIPVVNDIQTAAVTIRRTDIEALEFAPNQAEEIRQRTDARGAGRLGANAQAPEGEYPSFRWWLGPYVAASFFDPDNPVRADFGIELEAELSPAAGWKISGAVRQPLLGNIGEGRESDSVIQRVRSDAPLYAAQGNPAITHLTASYSTHIGADWYGRVTAGYLEPMFGGVSTEVLWKPFDSRLGLGLEVNYAKQRDFDQLFGFRDYDVVTGHASAYYDFGNGFHAQLDAGRYLAGDDGMTFALDREFDNGWRIGAFATLTDVSFEDFGEGSFDKGLRFSIPLGHFVGTPSARVDQVVVRPLTRDGGARLVVEDRLYETVRGSHAQDLYGSWGRFWR